MLESLKQVCDPMSTFRPPWSEDFLRRTIVTLAAMIFLGGCGGTESPDELGSPKPYFQTSYSGMFSNEEPDEGAIPSDGRTYRGAFRPLNNEPVAGVQFLLGNLTASDIKGAKMLMGISTDGNAEQLPTRNGVPNNEITGDPRTGWVNVRIGGAEDLPVPASRDGETAAGLAWTDLVTIANNLAPDEGEIVWRLWVPRRATAPYARTHSMTVDGGQPNEKFSAIRGLSVFEVDVRNWDQYQNSSYMYYGYSDGDAVSKPGTPKTWVTTPPPPQYWNAYSHLAQRQSPTAYVPAVASVPVLGVRWKATRELPVIEMVGDSITHGWADHEQVIGVDGIPGRLIRALGSGDNAQYTFINFGQSGWTPQQYLARWKGLARADTKGATALVFSIYSPNGFPDNEHDNQVLIDAMKENCLAAERAAHEYGRIFIPTFITGTNANLLHPSGWDGTGLVQDLLDWAKEQYGEQLLDLHDAVQGSGTIGPSMDRAYTNDGVHPNVAGYDALGARAVELFPAAFAAARAAQKGR